jgi:hypothetical protein
MAKKKKKSLVEKTGPEEQPDAEMAEEAVDAEMAEEAVEVERLGTEVTHAWVAPGRSICAARRVCGGGTKITLQMLHHDDPDTAARNMAAHLNAGTLTLDEPS